MRYIPLRSYGEAQVLKIENRSPSEIKELETLSSDEVLIEVHYSGINFADVVMRLGFYADAPKRPFTPGYEVSGIVKKLGKEVTTLKEGDRVFAGTFFGGYSDHVKIPAWQVIKLPGHLELFHGAGLPVTFLTAYNSIFRMGRVAPGDKIMIDCASGGVGTMALSLLSGMNVDVVGLTGSPSKKSTIEKMGARALTHEEFEKKDEGNFDFILNSSGGKSVRKHFARLGPCGRLVCLGISEGINNGKRDYFQILKTVAFMPRFSIIELFNHNKGIFALNALHLMQNTEWIKTKMKDFEIITNKKITPVIGATFPADDIAKAHRALETRQVTGKAILQWR